MRTCDDRTCRLTRRKCLESQRIDWANAITSLATYPNAGRLENRQRTGQLPKAHNLAAVSRTMQTPLLS